MSLITPRPRHEDPMDGNTAAAWSKSEDPQPVTDFVVGDADADSDEADNLKADKAHDAPDSVELVVSAALGGSSSEDEREDRAKSPACMSQEEVMRQLAADMLDDSEEGSDGEIHLGGGLAAAIDAFELDDDEDDEEFTLDSSPIRDPAARDARQRASDSDSSSDDGEVPPPYKSANPWAAAAEEETCGLSDGEGEDFGDTDEEEELEMDLHEEQYNHAACHQPQPHPIPGLDLDLQRQQVLWERSQRQSEFWARMGRDALLNEDDQRVALKILLQEAHRHHRRAREAGKPATSDFRWAAIAHDAMEEFEISGHSAVQRSISCMCLFSPASSASIYGEHEAERMRRAGRQQQTLQMLRLQAMCGGNEFFLAQPQPSHPRPE